VEGNKHPSVGGREIKFCGFIDSVANSQKSRKINCHAMPRAARALAQWKYRQKADTRKLDKINRIATT
jgi:hypothetical protein